MIYYIGENREFSAESNIELSSLDYALDYLNSLEYISADTETQGFDCHTKNLLLLQLGNAEKQFVINPQYIDIKVFKLLLESKTILFHNAKFDWKFLYKQGIDVKNIFDTFLAECILTTGLASEDKELSLKGVAFKYLNIDLDKSIRGDIHRVGLNEAVVIYASKDVKYLEAIMNAQLKLIHEWNLERVLKLENEVVRVFAKMEYDGIGFDSKKISEISKELYRINSDLIAKLDDIISKDRITHSKLFPYTQVQGDLFTDDIRKTKINWSSPAQKVDILNIYGMKTDTVEDKYLQKHKKDNPLIPLFIDLSKFNKLANTFGNNLLKFINPATKRIHSNIWQILSTGRISMEEPPLQQIPAHSELGKKIKSCFVASPGYKIVSADFSGFELRILAEFSQDPLWISIFNEGKDLHSELCAKTFNIPIEDVHKPFPGKPDISYRFLQKTINFMLAYGGSEFKLADVAQISVKEAKTIINNYFKAVPKVEAFLNMVSKAAVNSGFIRTDPFYFKRIRWFNKLDRDDFKSRGEVERAAKNTPPQGSNANITKQALIDLQNIIDDNNYPVRILLTIHDEIVTECIEDFAEEWKVILEKTMISAAQLLIKSIPVCVDGTINNYWSK